jgi:ABC-type multidrug transport system ATPase subunit
LIKSDDSITLRHVQAERQVLYQTINLCKEYGNPPHTVLNRVNLHIPKGSLFGLLGPNGAGKTTLLSILVGLVPKTSGRVLVNGVELEDCLKEVRDTTGMVPQDLALYPMLSARDNLNFFADAMGLRGTPRERNMEFAVTTTLLNEHLDKRVQNFSGGLKRRLNLAIGLLNQPSVLFLDEPTVGIDPQTRSLILHSIKSLNRQGVTVVYTSHYMDEVQQICDRVAIIDRGSILVQDDINRLLRRRQRAELRIVFRAADAERIHQLLSARFAIHVDDAHSLRIRTAEPLAVLQAIADQLAEPATAIERMAYGHQNLEELFLSLTGTEMRDADVG